MNVIRIAILRCCFCCCLRVWLLLGQLLLFRSFTIRHWRSVDISEHVLLTITAITIRLFGVLVLLYFEVVVEHNEVIILGNIVV